MKLRNLIRGICALSVLLIAYACSGGGSSPASKMEKHELFGKVPALKMDYIYKDSVGESKAKAEAEKAIKNKNMDKLEKLVKEAKMEEDALKLDFKENIEKAKTEIIGNDIPVEVAQDAGYEVFECKITDVDSSGSIEAVCKFRVTDPDKIKGVFGYSKGELIVTWRYLDKEGLQIGKDMAAYIKLPSNKKSENLNAEVEQKIQIRPHKTNNYLKDFGKVYFLN